MRQELIEQKRAALLRIAENEARYRQQRDNLSNKIWEEKAMAQQQDKKALIAALQTKIAKKKDEVGKMRQAADQAQNKLQKGIADLNGLTAKYMAVLMGDDNFDILSIPADDLEAALKMVADDSGKKIGNDKPNTAPKNTDSKPVNSENSGNSTGADNNAEKSVDDLYDHYTDGEGDMDSNGYSMY